ncbi:hypothetical protein a10_07443 [Streptomyces acidiscabies]|nr:hypothetical protein a10_07443 [Streptomyces acidiscabies]
MDRPGHAEGAPLIAGIGPWLRDPRPSRSHTRSQTRRSHSRSAPAVVCAYSYIID